VSFAKVPDMTPEVYKAVIDQAHQHGLRVAAHLFYLDQAQGLVGAGLDVVAHGVRDQDVSSAFIAELKRRSVGYIPTLTRDLAVFEYDKIPDYLNDPFFLRGIGVFRSAYYIPYVTSWVAVALVNKASPMATGVHSVLRMPP